jgi:hypothetical protein
VQSPASLTLVLVVVLLIALPIALAILASPIFAAIIFVLVFGAFLLWRGSRRAEAQRSRRRPAGVPSTEEAAADPVSDAGPRAAAASRPARR